MAGAIAATGALLPPALAARLVHHPAARDLPRVWHRLVTRSLGVHTAFTGTPSPARTLYVANHLSWLDIPVIGSHLKGSFVAKAEVGAMGVVGFLADMQDTIYVARDRRQQSAAQAGAIQTRLREGGNVILFPEGTSNDGMRILPFKSTLFSVVEGPDTGDFLIQPVTLAYTHLNGLPLTRNRQIALAWIGDMALGHHAMDVMRLGRMRAHIHCHPPVRRADFADRKALSRHCRDVIANHYSRLIRGGA